MNPKSGDTGDGEKRVRCLYCGANNFPSSPTCWQCGRPLQSLRPSDPASQTSALPPGRTSAGQFAQAVSRPALSVASESALAPKAAATLGLMFPYIGLPVGIVFLMLDDPRKTQLGWITIGWSVAGTIVSTLLLIPLMAPMLGFFKGFIPHGGHGGIPDLPSPSGDPVDINILLSALWKQTLLPNILTLGQRLAFCHPGCRV